VLSKTKRLRLFIEQLDTAPSASTADGALDLLTRVLNEVEDQHSGVENNPDAWNDDGRMYPPKEVSEKFQIVLHCAGIEVQSTIRLSD
jgi:hypothetical protein